MRAVGRWFLPMAGYGRRTSETTCVGPYRSPAYGAVWGQLRRQVGQGLLRTSNMITVGPDQVASQALESRPGVNQLICDQSR